MRLLDKVGVVKVVDLGEAIDDERARRQGQLMRLGRVKVQLGGLSNGRGTLAAGTARMGRMGGLRVQLLGLGAVRIWDLLDYRGWDGRVPGERYYMRDLSGTILKIRCECRSFTPYS